MTFVNGRDRQHLSRFGVVRPGLRVGSGSRDPVRRLSGSYLEIDMPEHFELGIKDQAKPDGSPREHGCAGVLPRLDYDPDEVIVLRLER